jgi:hypothetical protein
MRHYTRSLLAEEHEASALLARLRSAAARHPEDPSFGELIERLHAVSPEVRAWWPRREVAPDQLRRQTAAPSGIR